MKAIVAAVTLSLLSMPGHASTWLCIGEHLAQVKHKDGEVIGSESFENQQRWLVDENGVRPFGEDWTIIDKCRLFEGRPARCSSSDTSVNDFTMDPQYVFTLTGFTIDDDMVIIHYIVKGKCSKISN